MGSGVCGYAHVCVCVRLTSDVHTLQFCIFTGIILSQNCIARLVLPPLLLSLPSPAHFPPLGKTIPDITQSLT